MRITSGGNVGIGTTSPAVKFNVNSGGTSGNSFSAAFSDNTTNQNSIAFSHFDNNSRIYATFLAGAGSDQSLSFWTTLSNSAQFERMRITSGGNVLIGTTTSDAKLRVSGLSNGTQATFGVVDGRGLEIATSLVAGTNDAGSILNARGAGSGTLILQTEGTERMRITSGGNVGIGTTSPASILDIRSANIPRIQLVKTGILSWFLGDTQQDGTNLFSIGTDSGSNFRILNINNSGNVCIGRTATFGSERVSIESTSSNPIITTYNFNATAVTHHEIRNQNGIVGTIVAIGGGTVYNTLSDYRVKEDLKEINGLEKLLKLKVYNFKWKWNNERTDGVLAHELQEIIPYAVHGEKDNEQMQQVDYSKLVPVLVKAIQELSEKVKQLENK